MRNLGTFNFSANFEVQTTGMLDARMLVHSYADLLTFTSGNYIPYGFIVSVYDTDKTKRGIYQCIDNTNLSSSSAWERISAELGYTAENVANKNVANGYAGLDSNAKLPTALFPDTLLGNLHWAGSYDGSTITANSTYLQYNGQPLPTADSTNIGVYFKVSSAFTYNSVTYNIGDWIVSYGTQGWGKVTNSDSVSTVFGRTGTILAQESDYDAFYPNKASTYNDPSWITQLSWGKITNTPTTLVGYNITDAALDVNVVHKTGDETINGQKTFVGAVKSQTYVETMDPNGSEYTQLSATSLTVTDTVNTSSLAKDNLSFGNSSGQVVYYAPTTIASGTTSVYFPNSAGTLALTNQISWGYLQNKPTTVSGFGITDAEVISNKNQPNGYVGLDGSLAIAVGAIKSSRFAGGHLLKSGIDGTILEAISGGTDYYTPSELDNRYVQIANAFTNAQADAQYVRLTGSYSDPTWITHLAQSKIVYTGTSLQYIKGDGTYATFPTNISTFANDANYVTTTVGNSTYVRLSQANQNNGYVGLDNSGVANMKEFIVTNTTTPSYQTVADGRYISFYNSTGLAGSVGSNGYTLNNGSQSSTLNAGTLLIDYTPYRATISPYYITFSKTDTGASVEINSPDLTKITGSYVATLQGKTGTIALLSDIPTSYTFSSLTGTPTTLAGYGITDAYTKTQSDAKYPLVTGSYSDPAWITHLSYAKLTGAPTNVSSFTNDANYLTSVTARAIIQTITASVTLDDTYGTTLVDATAGNIIITLPNPASYYDSTSKKGKVWNIKRIDTSSNTVTITPSSGQVEFQASVTLPYQGDSYTIQTNGTNFYII